MIGKTSILLWTLCLCAALQLYKPTSTSATTVYTLTNVSGANAVAAFDRDSRTGLLTFKNLYPTAGSGNPDTVRASQGALVASDGYLYAVNPGSDNISAFRIGHDGVLELLGAPVSSGGVQPVSMAISKHGILYVANRGNKVSPANYSGFWLHEGHLLPIPASSMSLTLTGKPANVLFSQSGKLLLGSRPGDGIIDVFKVDEDGLLQRTDELGGQPGAFAMEFNPVAKHQLIALLARVPGSASYNMSNTGQLTPLFTDVDQAAIDPCWLIISKNGRLVWVAGFAQSGISLHKIGSDGALTLLNAHNTISFGRFSTFLATDDHQNFMYEVMPGADIGSISLGKIHTLRITGATEDGGLLDIQTVDIPNSTNPIGLVVVDDNDDHDDL